MADADDFDVEELRALLRGGPPAAEQSPGAPATKRPAAPATKPATKPGATRGARRERAAKPAAKKGGKGGRARGSAGGR